MTIDFTVLIAVALVAYVGYEFTQTDDDPFDPVEPFFPLEPVTCHPTTHGSGFTHHQVTYEFRIKKTNRSNLNMTHHVRWMVSGTSFSNCLDQIQEKIRRKNSKAATYDPGTWCIAHCYEWSFSGKKKDYWLVSQTSDSSTLGTPGYCERGAWDLNFPDE